MKFALPALALAALATCSPVAEPLGLDKRSYTCTTTGSDVKYHTKPDENSPAPGQYGAKGTKVTFVCWTAGGDVGPGADVWYKNTKGYYVTAFYVDEACFDHLNQC